MLSRSLRFGSTLVVAAALQWSISHTAIGNLVGYWPLDGDGTAVVGTNGNLVNGPTAAADRNGAAGLALAFNGGATQRVEIPGGGGFNGASAASVSMWVNWSGIQDGVCCGGTSGNVLGRQSNGVFSNNIIGLSTNNPATAAVTVQGYNAGGPIISAGGPVGDGVWKHIAVTFENGQQRLYVDGAPAGPASGVASNFNNNAAIPLAIGAWVGDGAGYSTSTIDEVGTFDEFLIEGKARSLYSLAVEPGLLYTLDDMDSIFDAYDNQSSVDVDGLVWDFATVSDLQDAGLLGTLGEVNNNGGQFGVLLDTAVGGVISQSQVVPEPASVAIWALLGIAFASFSYYRSRNLVKCHGKLPVVVLLVVLMASVAQAQITGVRVDHVSSELIQNFNRDASMTVDGSGLNITIPNSHSTVPDGTMWLNTGTTNCCGGISYLGPLSTTSFVDSAPRIGFDLGANYDLSSANVWNYNEFLTARGVNQANVLVSSDNITYTNPFGGAQALNIAPGANNVDFSQALNFAQGTEGRFVRFDVLSSHGGDNGFVGLSEVQFNGTLADNPPQTLIAGVTATASSELLGPFNRQAQFTVDGSGFNSGTGTHTVTPDGNMWLSTGNGAAGGVADPNPQITFDLGSVENVGMVEIWNYNEGVSAGTLPLRARGIRDLTVETSLDGAIFNVLDTLELFAAPGDANVDYHQTFFLNTEAQFVRFSNITSHGGDNNFVGLSEVQFFSQPAQVVPEPASIAIWSLIGLCLAGFGYYRVRRKK